jgi:hypothetical protein
LHLVLIIYLINYEDEQCNVQLSINSFRKTRASQTTQKRL